MLFSNPLTVTRGHLLWVKVLCGRSANHFLPSEPSRLTMTSPGRMFGAEAELHLALEHPNDLLICVTVAMKVLVCGGRNFRSPAQVFRALDRLHQEKPITELMQGGATGADQFAMEWAATKPEIKRYVCHADWETHGRAAGPIRNEKMLTWKPDLVVAFPGGDGTADMVRRAEAAGVPVQRF
jgi:SLOG family YspA-like protein